jgi:glycosyltransferase involved in cell wall biosynthesis
MEDWINSLDLNLISVVLPTYNRPTYLKSGLACIEKAAANLSSGRSLEVIVVDDCSDQLALDTINEFSSKLTIKLVRLFPNSGTVCIPRNIGISYIGGRTIAPVDDDCLCMPNKFEDLFSKLWSYPKNLLAYGGRENYNYDGTDYIYGGYFPCNRAEQDKKEVGLDNGQFLYKADVYRWVKPSFSINACDWHTYSSFADYGNFVNVGKPVCQYIWHGSNISLTPAHRRTDPISKLPNYLSYFKDGPFKNACKSYINYDGVDE